MEDQEYFDDDLDDDESTTNVIYSLQSGDTLISGTDPILMLEELQRRFPELYVSGAWGVLSAAAIEQM